MSRIRLPACAAFLLATLTSTQASAMNCLKDHKPYQLTGDSIEWSMAIAPGANCIQGLRWSYMQIFAVRVLQKPASGELVMVGPGFRYFAKPNFSGTDKFSLVVVGKNRREEGYSTVEITVSPIKAPPTVNSVSQPDSNPDAKLAEAATVH
jgi:hypothetical protein